MSRKYDLILYGATGYTGKYTAEYLQEHAPTDLRWAIAGRNAQKLEAVGAELKQLNVDRVQPGIEVVNHELGDLKNLAEKTTVLVSTVGPYWKYGTPVVEACVASRTHYLDVTGETPWVYDMIQRFHEKAQQTRTILLVQCGLDSVPADMFAYTLAKHIRATYSEGTESCVVGLNAKGGFSGGTAETALSISSAYPISFLVKSMAPFALSPIKSTAPTPYAAPRSILSTLLGYVKVPGLGYLTPWPMSAVDRALVHRSWGLFGGPNGMYGKNFRFEAFFRHKRAVAAFLMAWTFKWLGIAMLLPPSRWLLRHLVHKPGEGDSREEAQTQFLKYKATATSDSGKRVYAQMDLMNSAYYFTAVFVSTAALEILRGNGQSRAAKEGGIVTSAMLEEGYVERLGKAGVKISISPS